MGLWKALFGRLKNSSSVGWFERPHDFKPGPGGTITLCSQGKSVGLTQQQQYFITKIEHDYSLLAATIVPQVENAFREKKLKFRTVCFERESAPIYLVIPACNQQPIQWNIILVVGYETDYFINIKFADYQVDDVMIMA